MKRTSDLAFDRFWELYPRKVAKLAAQKAFARALRAATAEQIIAGVELYRGHLPDDVRFIAHPTTWLNQGRWLDEYEDDVALTQLSKGTSQVVRGMRDFLKASGE